MSKQAQKRKEQSIQILKQQNIPYIKHLPMIETSNEVRIRAADEIAKRAIACLLTIQLACDIYNSSDDIEEGKTFLQELLEKFGVEDCLTENEKKIFDLSTTEQETLNMIWKYEAYWVLLWALGIVEELNYPSETCDCTFAIEAVSQHDSFEQFMKDVKLRNIEEILDGADLIFRYDWACVDARIKGKEAPQELDGSVVVERHRGFNWLIDTDEDDDWDNVSTNT